MLLSLSVYPIVDLYKNIRFDLSLLFNSVSTVSPEIITDTLRSFLSSWRRQNNRKTQYKWEGKLRWWG